jgi:large subunit ribosomal protein L1
MVKLSKRQKSIKELKSKYSGPIEPVEAIKAIKSFVQESASKNLNQTVELAVQLGIDTKANDQQVRASVVLPSGTGKKKTIAVLAKGEKVKEAKEAGADFAGTEDLIKKIEEGWMGFDVLVSTPDCMSMLGKLGRVLGPRGLMPNPKDGTVTQDVKKAVLDLQAGKVSFRAEKTGAVVHMPIGKTNFSDEAILENYKAAMAEIQKHKPASSKGIYMKSIALSSTQGLGLRVKAE